MTVRIGHASGDKHGMTLRELREFLTQVEGSVEINARPRVRITLGGKIKSIEVESDE